MSKIAKGIKILATQGPKVAFDKVRLILLECNCKRANKKAIKEVHIITDKQREYQKNKRFVESVKFSIITPLYNTPEKYLVELLESLEKQTYSNWELCLADGSDLKHGYVRAICEKWAKKDGRVIYSHLEKNEGISKNTNECIKLASGDYFGLLDHDDILHESALFEVMSVIEKEHPDFLYTDEVKFSNKIEEACDFNFKPGFGKDELRSHNYICHFTVFSKKLLEKEEMCYRPEFDGSQDHDMVLRLTEKAEKVVHVPKVLYYWRVHPESVSMNLDSKCYAVDAAIRAIQEQLQRSGETGVVNSNLPYRTIYRTKYDIQEKNCKITIIVHGIKRIKEFDEFVERVKEIREFYDIRFVPLIENTKITFGMQLNQIVNKEKTDYIVVISAQCQPLNSAWIKEMLMYAQRKDVALVAPKILFENNTIAYAGIALDKDKKDKIRFLCQGAADEEQGYEAILRYVRNTTAVWRMCFMIERSKLIQLGEFVENISGYEEIDLSLRAIECGLLNVWTCFSALRLNEKYIIECEKDVKSFANRWGIKIEGGDPFYHPYWSKFKLV